MRQILSCIPRVRVLTEIYRYAKFENTARIKIFLMCLLFGSLFTGLIIGIGLQVCADYHSVAHYHYDSASYRLLAIGTYDTYKQLGLIKTLRELTSIRDSFDVQVRLIIYPKSLLWYHGHLLVQIPLMIIFFSLLMYTSYHHSGLYVWGIALSSIALCFGNVYHPVQGIWDYWKDNLAVWAMGSAFLAWFLSDNAQNKGWSALSGLLWSIVLLQRAVIAVYGGALFAPMLLYAIYQRWSVDTKRQFIFSAISFGMIPLLTLIVLLICQSANLYSYYFVSGYDYTDRFTVFMNLLSHQFLSPLHFRCGIIFLITTIVCCAWYQSTRISSYLTFAWLILGFPLLVIATRASYHSSALVIMILLMVSLSLLLPQRTYILSSSRLAITVLLIASTTSLIQAYASGKDLLQMRQANKSYRDTFHEICKEIKSSPPKTPFGIFFDEYLQLIRLHLMLDYHTKPWTAAIVPQPNMYYRRDIFMSIHDTYYTANFNEATESEITNYIVNKLEEHPETIAFIYTDPNRYAAFQSFYGRNPHGISARINTAIHHYILNSDRWRITRRIDSEVYGSLYVVRLSSKPLSILEKWQNAGSSENPTEFQLCANVGPHLRQLYCSGKYRKETHEGTSLLWLPSGRGGMSAKILAPHSQRVNFRSLVQPGPSCSASVRNMVVACNGVETRVKIQGSGMLNVPVEFHQGFNLLEVWCEDPADRPAPNGDTRELVCRLDDPKLYAIAPTYLDIPTTLAVAPNVRQISYVSTYPAEIYQDVYYQWLAPNRPALKVTLQANHAETVLFRTIATPGLNCSKETRTLAISLNGQITRLTLKGQMEVKVPLELSAGKNEVEFWCEDLADVALQGDDVRQLILRLDSPHFLRIVR